MEMKKTSCRVLPALALSLLTTACLFEEENLFDQPAATRLNNAVATWQQLLTSSPQGWVMEFYPADGSMGGYVLTARFNGAEVDMATELPMQVGGHLYEPGETIRSVYTVKSEQSVMLSFDTENPFIHYFSTPTQTNVRGIQSDYEFVFLGTSEARDTIFLRGKKYEQDMMMVRLNMQAAEYLEQTIYVRNSALLMRRDSIVIEGRKYPVSINREGVQITDIDSRSTLTQPCILTATDLKLRNAMTLTSGFTLQELAFDRNTGEFRADGAVIPCQSLHEQLLHPHSRVEWYFQIHQEKEEGALVVSSESYEMSDTLFSYYKLFDQSDISGGGTAPLIASLSSPGYLGFAFAGFNPNDMICLHYVYYMT